MRKEFPDEYVFFPETFVLPYELQDFKLKLMSPMEKLEWTKKKELVRRKPSNGNSFPSTAEGTPQDDVLEEEERNFVPPYFIVKPENMS